MTFPTIVSRRKAKLFVGLTIVLLAFSIYLVAVEETETMLASWLIGIFLLPGFLLGLRSQLLSVRVMVWTALVTQLFSLPLFFLERDDYAFGDAKPFGFSAIDVLPIASLLGLFLILFAIFADRISKVIALPRYIYESAVSSKSLDGNHLPMKNHLGAVASGTEKKSISAAFVISFSAMVVPLNLWMFSKGVGLTGIEPPELPFRLSGILFYLTKYIVPAIIAYLYSRTERRSIFVVLWLAGYALLVGVTSISRGGVLFLMLPVIIFSWIDKKYFLLAASTLLTLPLVMIATYSRQIVYGGFGNRAEAITDQGVFGTLISVMELDNFNLNPFFAVATILNRIESFQSLVHASQFDVRAIGGVSSILLKIIWHPIVEWDMEAYHIEWQGFAIFEGHYSGGSFLSLVLMASNSNIAMTAVIAMIAAVFLVVMEANIYAVVRSYELPLLLAQTVIIVLALQFFTAAGANVFVIPWLLLIFIRIAPTLFRFRSKEKFNAVKAGPVSKTNTAK